MPWEDVSDTLSARDALRRGTGWDTEVLSRSLHRAVCHFDHVSAFTMETRRRPPRPACACLGLAPPSGAQKALGLLDAVACLHGLLGIAVHQDF